MRRWIQDCEDNHPLCQQLKPSTRSLPTRLIHLGDTSDTIKPVLHYSASLPAGTKYTTLSHCWRGLTFLRLLLGNESAFRDAIPVLELSKTFKEAMEVTRRLGVPYIWIDSLCIIQDSEEDWRQEAARMGEVYQGSYCNIAATAAKDGRDGLFRKRTLLDVEPCRVQAAWAPPRNGTYFSKATYFCRDLGSWGSEVQDTLLLSRGWVSQEVVLARRTLHFGRKQVSWECVDKRACETYPDRVPTTNKPALHPASLDLESIFRYYDGKFIEHELWKMVVQAYSRCDLTFKTKDKLVAISGLAQNLGLPPDTYLAGLWRRGLEEQILWRVPKGERPCVPTGTAEYRAPTWSWASVDGPVFLKVPTLKALAHVNIDILNAGTELVDASQPFGQVRGGYIRMRCMLAHAYLTERIVVLATHSIMRNGQWVDVPYDSSDPERFQAQHFFEGWPVMLEWDRGKPIFSKRYYCLFVNQHDGRRGLIVQPTGRSKGEYERVGYFSFSIATVRKMTADAQFTNPILKPIDDSELYELMEIEPDSGMPIYMITLV
ncbi:hypothetical protein LTR56_026669 [Elasticomyces elasticus]|nr:hypothetical protein LTR56_026669 [Elasticomyces elasticus]